MLGSLGGLLISVYLDPFGLLVASATQNSMVIDTKYGLTHIDVVVIEKQDLVSFIISFEQCHCDRLMVLIVDTDYRFDLDPNQSSF